MKNNQKIETHVLKKYSVIKKLGSGAYGHVWKVQSKQTKKVFALKKIFDAFQHSTDAQRTYREISVLKKLSHQKVIDLEQVIPAQNNQDIYLVFQYMQSDLYHLIYDGKLQPIHIKYIIYQLLQGLNYLHNSNLIHRDLKPSNILLNSDCSLKICDFGLVRYIGQKGNDNILTENVATRWYRAPQVLLGSNSYDTKADIWSTGCIIAQMLLKNPIFPGNCTTNQLQRILRLTGQPSQSDIAAIQSELTQVMISQVNGGKIKQIDYFAKIEKQNHSVLELLNKMLSFNPNKRPSALEALKSPYFEQFFNQKDLIVKKQPIFMEVDENIRLQKKQYLQIIKQKFTKCNQIIKQFNHSHVSNSPKRFSEIRNSRKSSKSIKKIEKIQQQKDSHSKTKTLKRDSSTNLFKQLCQKTESINKKKDNSQKKVSNYQSSLDKENKSHQKNKSSNQQKANLNKTHMNFTHLKKQQKVPRASFTGLRKVSKLQR